MFPPIDNKKIYLSFDSIGVGIIIAAQSATAGAVGSVDQAAVVRFDTAALGPAAAPDPWPAEAAAEWRLPVAVGFGIAGPQRHIVPVYWLRELAGAAAGPALVVELVVGLEMPVFPLPVVVPPPLAALKPWPADEVSDTVN